MKSENGSASGAGKQASYKGGEKTFTSPNKDGPPMNIDFHSPSASIHTDMKGPGMESGPSSYPKLDSQEMAEQDTPPHSLADFWKGEGKDKSSYGDMGSTSGPMFSGKMPAGISIKREI